MMARKIILSFAALLWVPFLLAAVLPQTDLSAEKAQQLLAQLSPDERVGQLFAVSFQGRDISANSQIYTLIRQYHVGGVILNRESGNWRSGVGEAAGLQQMTNGLQQIAIPAGEGNSSASIPLFLLMNQEGDGYPFNQVISETAQLPSQMAIGATWDPDLAYQVGIIAGNQLSILGVNMLLGPSLDVLEDPNPGARGDLGVRSFGGDPFWVGKLGHSYIRGVQMTGRVAVIVTNFPGIGASDRSPEEEIATVRKSMDDLTQIDLSPFAFVTAGIPGTMGVADGFLVSHIRYQGLQGNIRATTRPISLDSQALLQLLSMPEFSGWRQAGGLTVSASLGARSIRDFYDPTGVTFSNRAIAIMAFQAGNDLIQLSDFAAPGFADEAATIMDTIQYFRQRYAADMQFAAAVDQSVLRILTVKYRLYPDFSLDSAQVPADFLPQLTEDNGVSAAICRKAATLISPQVKTDGETAVEPPSRTDRVLILTDSRQESPCPACPSTYWIDPTAMAQTILRLYGPTADKLINPQLLKSYTLTDLNAFLRGESNREFDAAFNNSTYIVVVFLQPRTAYKGSGALQELLSQRSDLIRKRKVVVFSMDAPYYLDSTETSKLDGYYGMYSKVPACIETAARILFGDLQATGFSPVSVEATGYDLINALTPNPLQIIPLAISGQPLSPIPQTDPTSTPTVAAKTETATSTPVSEFRIGDTLYIEAGAILDRNGHSVPDGTVVRFRFEYPREHIPSFTLESTTVNGRARVEYALEWNGELILTASSEPALTSVILQLAVSSAPAGVTPVNPTGSSSTSATRQATNRPTQPTPTSAGGAVATWHPRTGLVSLGVSLFSLAAIAATAYLWIVRRRFSVSKRRIIWAIGIGGLTGFNLAVLLLPTAARKDDVIAVALSWLLSVLGAAIGVGVGGWRYLDVKNRIARWQARSKQAGDEGEQKQHDRETQ